MTNQIVPQNATLAPARLVNVFQQYAPNEWLLENIKPKSARYSRMSLYVDWLNTTGNHWTSPALADYADYLLHGERVIDHNGKVQRQNLTAGSAKSHLSTIRGQFKKMMGASFKTKVKDVVSAVYPDGTASDNRARYLDMMEDIQDALDPNETDHVKIKKKQDTLDTEHTRLSESEAQSLIESPGIDTLIGLRDTALLYFMLATGLREAELCALNVEDLRTMSGGQLGVHVRDGKGAKERHVPYGDLSDCLTYVDAWLAQANITAGAVFRGFKDRYTPQYEPGAKSPAIVYGRLTERLNVRSVNHILKQYPVSIDGTLQTICPHDTRRTYARLQYESGMDMLALRDNLGHADFKTTQGYIGEMDKEARRGKRIIRTSHDRKALANLADVPKLDLE